MKVIAKLSKQKNSLLLYLLLSSSVLAGLIGSATGQSLPRNDIPTPLARPFLPTENHEQALTDSPMKLVLPQARPTPPDSLITSSFARIENPETVARTLTGGLDLVSAGEIAKAIALRDSLSQGSLDRQIMTWFIVTARNGVVPRDEILKAAAELPGWPGLMGLRNNLERALLRENPPADIVISTFKSSPPQTREGMVALARAFISNKDNAQAQEILTKWWPSARLTLDQESEILAEFAPILTRELKEKRLAALLYQERLQPAKLLADALQAQSIYHAYVALTQNSPNIEKAIAAVDSSWRSNPAYLFLQIRHLRRAGKFQEAAKLMLQAPTDAGTLIDPDAWWIERRQLSRELLDIGDAQLAYQIAAAHAAESPAKAVEAEFHAGWYALRGLKQPKLAMPHFAKIAATASGAISASRAYYWLGRAAEEGAQGNNEAYYRQSARYGTSFYGQLSAEKLGIQLPALSYPSPTDAERVRFSGRPAVQAIKRLEQIGYSHLAAPLYTRLAQELNNIGELALLAVMAEKNQSHYLALRVGKLALQRGLDVGALSHPIGAIPASADIDRTGLSLAYAIARQESEFNVAAVSSAGARGLLQLMPATAKGVASRNNINFTAQKLTTDAAYNATLGSFYLAEQLDRFEGSYVLTIAGYNAGPARATQWVEKYGDPRGKSLEEVVDWIERIPYSETRNYVQRVMENYQVYKTRLTGKSDIRADLIYGRR
ncbi:soluble lytic murein transglycosylase [Falsochrobactrum ovis]|uniref:Soluble lytic murein transglycosylase n=1 Tax=Falsochrobactrum ovis TaxID=1293442 RepID=A0A364JVG3_9HYPH|nr:lytic transglycosylase domain-containing protein [Falsochrobactrum ovis]RAK28957.1 soluble lytic murein transglycosylase [Falsochrobactrum ovis]